MNARERDTRLTTADLASAPAAEERVERDRMADEGGRPRERWDGNGDAPAGEEQRVALFPDAKLDQLRVEWKGIQSRFVDEPRESVEAADHLVATTVQRLAQSFARERTNLEAQWGQGDHSTEDLRQALRRYRSFFDRLLSV
jgi:hypothetical protein